MTLRVCGVLRQLLVGAALLDLLEFLGLELLVLAALALILLLQHRAHDPTLDNVLVGAADLLRGTLLRQGQSRHLFPNLFVVFFMGSRLLLLSSRTLIILVDLIVLSLMVIAVFLVVVDA